MSYKFKYHPDGVVCRNGTWGMPYNEFISANPDFPLKEGEFMELKENNELEIISEFTRGSFSGIKQEDLSPYQNLIDAIYNLGE